jgi:hypothetical protein
MPDSDLRCVSCRRLFDQNDQAAVISARIMGDECTDCYYWCPQCQVYTLRLYRDVFCGEETSRDSEPIPKAEGDRRLALIRACPEPWNERCQCPAHHAYFGDWLD